MSKYVLCVNGNFELGRLKVLVLAFNQLKIVIVCLLDLRCVLGIKVCDAGHKQIDKNGT